MVSKEEYEANIRLSLARVEEDIRSIRFQLAMINKELGEMPEGDTHESLELESDYRYYEGVLEGLYREENRLLEYTFKEYLREYEYSKLIGG